ncbi:trafficking protein particle complex subunit 13 [Bacillus rossius redtenbacheri]|uniref:trafficking protein particle complex subunit 13 n=1 Tax=Bacillus rossius redtenbacheri TaxID=93214 RepID=UPI002FDD4E9B
MEVKEKTDLLALKVMRLTRPTLCSPLIVTCNPKDLPGNLLNTDLKQDITSVPGVETLAAGQFLLLPQSFGNIYLGETFSSYICVHNDSNQVAKDVIVQADLQTSSQRIPLSSQHRDKNSELKPQETLDDVIHHEVKEVGTHILVCEVSYVTPMLSRQSFRKFFKFQVLKPLDVKTKFYNAESDEVYLEAQVQNITTGPICLEKVSLESSHLFKVTSLNATSADESVFGHVNVVQPQASRQFLYCLAPQPSLTSDPKLLSGATNVGKLDIVWRSNLGERGRLQTSQLQRMAPDYGDIRLSIQTLPNIVYLEEEFSFTCRIINTCERAMDLVLSLESIASTGLEWSGVSGRQLGRLESGTSLTLPLCLVPLTAGLHNISGIRITDVFLKRTYDYDDLAQVFVVQRFSDDDDADAIPNSQKVQQ